MSLCACNGNCLKYGTRHPEGNVGSMSDRTNELPDRYLRARLTPIRQALWDNGEITIAGLARLDRALGIQTYNQCDGCARGLPTDNHGNHIGPGGFWGGDFMACTADRYTGESDDGCE